MDNPDLLDFAFSINHMQQFATDLASNTREAEIGGDDIVTVLRRKLPEMRQLRHLLSDTIDFAEKAIGQ